MSAEEKYPIDFNLYDKHMGGMMIKLCPGNDVPIKDLTISLDDRAFYLIEPYLKSHWGNENNYSHFGFSKIPISIWSKIIRDVNSLRGSLISATNPENIEWLGVNSEELKEEFAERFSEAKGGAIEMLGQFQKKVSAWIPLYQKVYFYGL